MIFIRHGLLFLVFLEVCCAGEVAVKPEPIVVTKSSPAATETPTDRERLNTVMGKPTIERAQALAELLPLLEKGEYRAQVFGLMVQDYVANLKAGASSEVQIEEKLVRGVPDVSPKDRADACYLLATNQLRLNVASDCLKSLDATSLPEAQASVCRLAGTLAFLNDNFSEANNQLACAAAKISLPSDPWLHQRLSLTWAKLGKVVEACNVAKDLFRLHPLLPGATDSLQACVAKASQLGKVVKTLTDERKKLLLARRRAGDTPAPILAVDNSDLSSLDLDLAVGGQITVLAFFSSWCRHCASELPRLNAFARKVMTDPQFANKVRVIGVRTAVERETVLWDDFVKDLKPNFTIYTDAALSMAFGGFARAHGIEAALPTVAVLDAGGVVRYFIESGDYRDIESELFWTVLELLRDKKKLSQVGK